MIKKTMILAFISASVLIILTIAAIFAYPYLVPQSFEKALNYNPEEITELQIVSGSTGKSATLTEKEEIAEFLARFRNVTVKKKLTPAPSNNIGFHLSATLRTENGIVSRFNFGAGAVIADLEADVRYEMSSELYESETVQMEDKYDLNFKTFPEVLGYIPEDIKKVVIENGLNGKSSELTDKTEIQKFLSFFDGTSLYRLWEAPYADSFPISVTMSEGLTDTVWFSFGEGSGVRTSDTAFPDVVYRSDVGFSAEKIRQFVETYGLQ